MKRTMRLTLALCLLLAACGTPATPPLNPVASNPVRSASELRCSLPVATKTHIGFVDFPSGQFREDPTSPKNRGFGLFYSQGAHTWVTTYYRFGDQLISPDGTEIASADAGPIYSGPSGSRGQGYTDIYLTDVTTQKMRHVGQAPGRARVIAYRPEGLYLDAGYIYLMNVSTGKYVTVGPKGPDASTSFTGLWFWVTASAAWSSLIALPNQGDHNSVLSMSLRDGSVTNWYTAPATRSVSIIGFVTPDEPLMVEYNTEPYTSMTGVVFMLLTAPGVVRRLSLDPSINAWGFTDSMGVWLSSPGHLWLYDSAGLIPMAAPGGAVGSEIPGVAGRCS